MKVGIMQPYLFPYIGYFQLIYAVDKFIIYDDVQYINGGWVNRNRIQIKNKDYLFTFSLKKHGSLDSINTRSFSCLFTEEKLNFLKLILTNYKKAPYFYEIYNLLSTILDYKEQNISLFITNSLKLICNYLEVKTPFYISSQLDKNNELKGQDKVIYICKIFKSTIYINQIGGKDLYSKKIFTENNLSLFFLKTDPIIYEHNKQPYIPNLSIVDVMMYNSKEDIIKMLKKFILI